MLSALFAKEWKQLRLVRWGAISLGLVLPLAFLAGSEAALRGLSLAGRLASYSSQDLFFELLPAVLAIGLWPLTGLLAAAQSFAGDRAAGTEAFLLDRPVPLGRIWRARLAASLATLAATASITGAIAAAFAAASGGTTSRWHALGGLIAVGAVLSVVAWIGGLTAASFVDAPLAAVLLGIVLGALPAWLSIQLAALFPLAEYRGLYVGGAVPWILLPGYLVVSFVALARGEPAGRGRIGRALGAAGVSAALVVLSFLLGAPLAIRASSGRYDAGAWFYPGPAGRFAVVIPSGGSRGLLLVNADSGSRWEGFPPASQPVQWNQDGTRFAFVTWGGPFGSLRRQPRLEWLDAERPDDRVGIELDDEPWFYDSRWVGPYLVVPFWRRGDLGISVVDTESRTRRTLSLRGPFGHWSFVGPTAGGKLFVAVAPEGTPKSGGRRGISAAESDPLPYAVREVDLATGELSREALVEDRGAPMRAGARLSPSGRFWLRDGGAGSRDLRDVVEIATGRTVISGVRARGAQWIAGDRLVWSVDETDATRLFEARPGAPPRELRSWTPGVVTLAPSPNRTRLLVQIRPDASSSVTSAAVLEVEPSRWIEVDPPPTAASPGDVHRLAWAGPSMLARSGPGYCLLQDLDRPGRIVDLR